MTKHGRVVQPFWRPAFDLALASGADFAPFGTYEVKGSTLIIRVIVAKSVDVMTRETPIEVTFKLEGPNTLWLISATVPTEHGIS